MESFCPWGSRQGFLWQVGPSCMLEPLRRRLAWLLCARLARERRPRHLDALRGRPAHTEGLAADRTPGGLQPILTAEGCGLDSNRLSWQGPGVRAARSASELLRPGVEARGGAPQLQGPGGRPVPDPARASPQHLPPGTEGCKSIARSQSVRAGGDS